MPCDGRVRGKLGARVDRGVDDDVAFLERIRQHGVDERADRVHRAVLVVLRRTPLAGGDTKRSRRRTRGSLLVDESLVRHQRQHEIAPFHGASGKVSRLVGGRRFR